MCESPIEKFKPAITPHKTAKPLFEVILRSFQNEVLRASFPKSETLNLLSSGKKPILADSLRARICLHVPLLKVEAGQLQVHLYPVPPNVLGRPVLLIRYGIS